LLMKQTKDITELGVLDTEYREETVMGRGSKGTTLVPFDPLQRYLAEVRRYPLLDPEEERRLAIQFREDGDVQAGHRLIISNLRLVVHFALKFQRYWMMSLLDLIQEGNIGLIKAVEKFEPYRNVKFSYYASFWIKAYIIKFVMDNWRLVKVGTTQAQRKLFFNLNKEKEKLAAQGYDLGPKLLAQKLGTRERDVIEMDQRLGGWDVSLESQVSDNSDMTYKDLLPSGDVSYDEKLIEAETRDIIFDKLEKLRNTLKDKELYIFEKRLISDSPLTLQKIGNKYHISKERVRQIESRLKEKIKRFLKEEIPDFNEKDFRIVS